MKLKVVKSKIQMTECADIVCDGMYCSEPIITLDDKGQIIDNYFMFSRSSDFSEITVPTIMFGIYSDIGRTAYISQELPPVFEKESFQESFEPLEKMQQAFIRYEELYPIIRDNAYCQITDKVRDDIKDYFHCLHVVSGDMLYMFYKKLFPDFFEWARVVLDEDD